MNGAQQVVTEISDYEWTVAAPSRIARIITLAIEFQYRITKVTLLRVQLEQARAGILVPQWRGTLKSAELNTLPPDQQVARDRAITELIESPIDEWEPHRGCGWRKSLDSWFDTTKRCLAATQEAETLIRAETRLPADSIAARTAIDTDLATASYRAGLAAGGLDVPDWYEWLIERVVAWPDKQRRDEQLDLMTLEPSYRETIEQVPKYWA